MNEVLSMFLVIAIAFVLTTWVVLMNPMGIGTLIAECFGKLYRHKEECTFAASVLAPVLGVAYKYRRKKPVTNNLNEITKSILMFDLKNLRFFSLKSKERKKSD